MATQSATTYSSFTALPFIIIHTVKTCSLIWCIADVNGQTRKDVRRLWLTQVEDYPHLIATHEWTNQAENQSVRHWLALHQHHYHRHRQLVSELATCPSSCDQAEFAYSAYVWSIHQCQHFKSKHLHEPRKMLQQWYFYFTLPSQPLYAMPYEVPEHATT